MTGTSQQHITDVDPFAIDPLLFSKLNQKNISVATIAVVSLLGTIVSTTYTALLTNYFELQTEATGFWQYVWAFARYEPLPEAASVPFLADVPSMRLIHVSGLG